MILKTATLEAATEAAGKSDPNTSVLPRQKQPLPLFQTSTSAFFCVNVVDAGVRKLRHEKSPEVTPSVEANSAQTRSALYILHGEVVNGETSDIGRSELDYGPESVFESSTGPQAASIPSSVSNLLHQVDYDHLMHAVETFASLEHPMYPIVDVETVLQRARNVLASSTPASFRHGRHLSEVPSVRKDDLALVSICAAIGLLAEGDTHQELAMRLFESVRSDVEAMVWSAAVDLKDLVLMTLVTLFHFHCGKWRLAWRFQGNISRIILELGLNRRVILERSFPNIKCRIVAINTLWTIFVLEQHLSYALGFSNAMPNLRLESDFPQPVDAPFLTLMIDYASIGRQSCDALLSDKVLRPEQLPTWQDDFAYFQYRVSLWSIRATESFPETDESPGVRMVRIILQLRAHHVRILVARAFLCSNFSNAAPLDIWSIVNRAAETIQTLSQLNVCTREYCFHEAQFNHFLVSALDILLFATTHKSSGVGSPSANGEALSIPPETAQKAKDTVTVALDHLCKVARASSQSRYLWERVRAMILRLNIVDSLSPTIDGGESALPMHFTTSACSFPENSPSTGLALDQSGPVANLEPGPFMFFNPDDAASWQFQDVYSSGFDFDLTEDLSALLNTTC